MTLATNVPPPPSALATAAAVRVVGVNHSFGRGETRKQVLFDNHLEVRPGEIVIMTGPSGSGKTTLLTLIGGLRTVQEGQVSVLGRELNGCSAAELVKARRDIGFIFQAHNLFDSLTAAQNVQLALELKEANASVRRQRAVELLTKLGLEHRVHYKPEALSGGQRQRVAIARALANHPQLILADEPTAALDEKSGRDVVNLLEKLAREENCTSLIVTHDNRILDVADRLVNLVDGHIKTNVLVRESVAVSEFLSKCDAFTMLPSSTLATMAEKMGRERFPARAAVFREGDPADKFYVIRSGSVEVVHGEGQPSRRVVCVLEDGKCFGQMALLSGGPRTATIVARQDLEVYSLSQADFHDAVARSASLKEQLYTAYLQSTRSCS